jgi:hypothetical protein
MDDVVVVVLLLLLHGGLGAAVAYGLYRLVPRKTSRSSWIAWGVFLGPVLMCPYYLFGGPLNSHQQKQEPAVEQGDSAVLERQPRG